MPNSNQYENRSRHLQPEEVELQQKPEPWNVGPAGATTSQPVQEIETYPTRFPAGGRPDYIRPSQQPQGGYFQPSNMPQPDPVDPYECQNLTGLIDIRFGNPSRCPPPGNQMHNNENPTRTQAGYSQTSNEPQSTPEGLLPGDVVEESAEEFVEPNIPTVEPNPTRRSHTTRMTSEMKPPLSKQVVRLRNGVKSSDGYLEIQLDPEGWGIVCDKPNKWSIREANIVCKQLGYERYRHFYTLLFLKLCFFINTKISENKFH